MRLNCLKDDIATALTVFYVGLYAVHNADALCKNAAVNALVVYSPHANATRD